ncbi:MAG: cytochrome c [Acidobacteria bacterium]|nr:cytochrome c [Acidobacteriota bacterium]
MKRFIAALILLMSVALIHCGSARRGLPITGPMELKAEQRAGQVAFMRTCHQCHPNGEGGLGPAINNKPLPSWLMKFQIRQGLGAMPAFDEDVLSDQEVDQIIAYLKELRHE